MIVAYTLHLRCLLLVAAQKPGHTVIYARGDFFPAAAILGMILCIIMIGYFWLQCANLRVKRRSVNLVIP